MQPATLSKFTIQGFKSIKNFQDFEPGRLNILIGPNGAGKSNFITFFKFLSWMLNSDGKLREHVAYLGGANDILHDGADKTKTIDAHLEIETGTGINEYKFSLMFTKPDNLVFREELYRYSAHNKPSRARWADCGVGHTEARLPLKESGTANTILALLRKLIVYQFHNTSDTAAMRLKWTISDGRWLKENGQNLASFLYRLQTTEKDYYIRIVKYLRLLLPFFDDFEFYEEFGQVLLRWKEKGTPKIFNAGQASDGMLRTIALVSLLAQPPRDLPAVLFLDEPELGLHPSAIDAIAGLIKAASGHCQVFVATQSVSLVNQFDLNNIVVIERTGRDSHYIRPDAEKLQIYLDEYTTGQLWEKNIIGGRP
jgi:predicted ATPase